MVLYYNSSNVSVEKNQGTSSLPANDRNKSAVPLVENQDPNLLTNNDVLGFPGKLYTRDTPQVEVYPENKGLLENLSDSLFGESLELQTRLLEENFLNLSTDEKINYMFKTSVIQNKTTSKYLRIMLFFLLLIIIKLYS
tara:strand:- start:132 stop:548 length:417 start_codon:yes stop_codon:yes gene_type:complete